MQVRLSICNGRREGSVRKLGKKKELERAEHGRIR